MQTITIFLLSACLWFRSQSWLLQFYLRFHGAKTKPRDSQRQLITLKSGRLNDINNSKLAHFTQGGRTHVSPVDWWYFQFDSISWRRNEMVWTQKKSNHNHINLVSFRSFVCSLINFGNYKRWVFITLNIEQRTKRTTNEKNVSESISAYNISTLWSL